MGKCRILNKGQFFKKPAPELFLNYYNKKIILVSNNLANGQLRHTPLGPSGLPLMIIE
jgi:hypothetical protein